MKTKNRMIALVVVSLLFQTAVAQEAKFWLSKPYDTWSKDEIKKIISDSPWSKVVGSSDKSSTVSYVTVRLRSALPIRQALVRFQQIEQNYEKMKGEKKAEFEKLMEGALGCPACVDNYVVTLAPPISSTQLRSGIFALKNVRMESLQDTVFLMNDKGEKRSLAHFVAPKSNDGEATFFFPRLDQAGNPLLTNQNKSVSFLLEIRGSQFSGTAIPSTVTFDLAEMIIDEKVNF